jgi:hypothetical protein
MPTRVTDKEPETEKLLEGFTDGLAWQKLGFRGEVYLVRELPIGEYDEIVKKATRKEKVTDPDTGVSNEVDMLDQNLQSRLMLKECLVEPASLDVKKLGTRLTVALNRAINNLHYGDEPDELRPVKKDDDGEGPKGSR